MLSKAAARCRRPQVGPNESQSIDQPRKPANGTTLEGPSVTINCRSRPPTQTPTASGLSSRMCELHTYDLRRQRCEAKQTHRPWFTMAWVPSNEEVPKDSC